MYYIIYPLLDLLSLLPFFILYCLSDALASLLYHVFKYRRDVVADNLVIAFLEKSEAERKKIARQFYQYFTFGGLNYVSEICDNFRIIYTDFYAFTLFIAKNQWHSGINVPSYYAWQSGDELIDCYSGSVAGAVGLFESEKLHLPFIA